MFCEICGKELKDGQVCGCAYGRGIRIIESMKNRMGIGEPERNATDAYERGMKIVPDSIRANENEIPVKQYNIAVLRNLLKLEHAEGRLQVTNKRVIFRATGRSIGGRTTLQNEFALDKIVGVEARRNYKFSFLYLIFAVLIMSLSNLIVGGSIPNISNYIQPTLGYVNRSLNIMEPSHVLDAYAEERDAILQRKQAEENIPKCSEKLKVAKDAEEKAVKDTTIGVLKTRKVESYRDWWGNVQYKTESYRDKSPAGLAEAQERLNVAVADRENAEKNLQRAIEEKDTFIKNEKNAIKKREDTVHTWKVLMTLLGLALGIGGIVPFFVLYKKWGLKLFILNISVFGFTLSLVASGSAIFNLLLILSIIIIFACIILFCFRPNLVIRIKDNGGGEAAVDIRKETQFTIYTEKGIGFYEVIPTEETEGAIREIGAIINDIQKLGDLGVDKWKQ